MMSAVTYSQAACDQQLLGPQPGTAVIPAPVANIQVIQITKPPARRYVKYASSTSQKLGKTLILVTIATIIINAVAIHVHNNVTHGGMYDWQRPYNQYDDNRDYIKNEYSFYWDRTFQYSIGTPFWVAPLLFILGCFTITAAHRPTKCQLMTCHVLGVISAVMCCIMVALSLWAIETDITRLVEGNRYKVFYEYIGKLDNVTNPPPIIIHHPLAHSAAKKVMVLSVLYAVASVVNLVVCFWICFISGRVLFPKENNHVPVDEQMAMAQPNELIVLDSSGRQIHGAQVIQMPSSSAAIPMATIPPTYTAMEDNRGLPEKPGRDSPPPAYS